MRKTGDRRNDHANRAPIAAPPVFAPVASNTSSSDPFYFKSNDGNDGNYDYSDDNPIGRLDNTSPPTKTT